MNRFATFFGVASRFYSSRKVEESNRDQTPVFKYIKSIHPPIEFATKPIGQIS